MYTDKELWIEKILSNFTDYLIKDVLKDMNIKMLDSVWDRGKNNVFESIRAVQGSARVFDAIKWPVDRIIQTNRLSFLQF